MTHADRATEYARDVLADRILACRYVKLACQRHLDWLEKYENGGDYFWDEVAANRACRLIELLPHVKGRWAARGEKIRLEPFQCFAVAVPFGWVHRDSGLRVIRRVYYEWPRKNAKSTTTAGVGHVMFAEDGEYGAEVYSGATTEKQAWEVFGPARLMAKNTPELCDHYGIEVNAKNLNILATNSKFEPVIGNPGDGPSPTFSITDEYHEHKTDEQYDTFVTGMGAREQPIAWVITTAGSDESGPCYALRTELVHCLEGTIENDELWGVIYTIDEDDDWTSEAALVKANPNYGVSVFAEYLKSQQRDAVNNPRKQSTFKTKHLDVWVTAASPYFNLEKWKRLGDEGLHPDDFHGEACWMGLDLASKLDLTAAIKVFMRNLGTEEEPDEHWYVFGDFYTPEARIEDPKLKHYKQWVEQGYLIATGGNITDYDWVEENVLSDAIDHRIVQLGFDPWNATQVATHLMNQGVDCVEIPQTAKNLSNPMKWIQALIEDGRIHHNGNPAMSWMIGNVTAQVDRNDNVFPRKEQEQSKIDGAVALIIAKGRALDAVEQVSVYETRGPIIV